MTRRPRPRRRTPVVLPLVLLAALAIGWWLVQARPFPIPSPFPAPPGPSAAGSSPGGAPTTSASAAGDVTAPVVWIADGDTLDVSLDGVRTRVRLVNIDAPELSHDGVPAQCLAEAARQELSRLAPVGSPVRLTTYGQDRFGRLVAAAWLPDGRLVNAEVVRAGLAGPLVVSGQRPVLDAVLAAQADAAASGRGLHGAASCSLPARLAAARVRVDGLGILPAPDRPAAARSLLAEATAIDAELRADARDSLVQGLTADELARADAAASRLLADAQAALARLGG